MVLPQIQKVKVVLGHVIEMFNKYCLKNNFESKIQSKSSIKAFTWSYERKNKTPLNQIKKKN